MDGQHAVSSQCPSVGGNNGVSDYGNVGVPDRAVNEHRSPNDMHTAYRPPIAAPQAVRSMYPGQPLGRPPGFVPMVGKPGENPAAFNNVRPNAAVPPAQWPPNMNGVSAPGGLPGHHSQDGVFSVPPQMPVSQGPPNFRPMAPPTFTGSPSSANPAGAYPSHPSPLPVGGPLVQRPASPAQFNSSLPMPAPVAGGAHVLPPPPRLGMPYNPPSVSQLPPPSLIRPPPVATAGATLQPGRPNELPAPFAGHGQYNHQVHAAPGVNEAVTPAGSESQRSSRVPSPVNTPQNYDNMEGQFCPGPAPGDTRIYTSPGSTPSMYPLPPAQSPPYSVAANSLPASTAPHMAVNRPPPPMSHVPTYPPPPNAAGMLQPGQMPGQLPQQGPPPVAGQAYPARMPVPPQPSQMMGAGRGNTMPNSYPPGTLANNFGAMNLQNDANRPVNLLQDHRKLPTDGPEIMAPNLPNEFKKVNCNSDIMVCTLSSVPATQALLNKSRLPLGLLIHPFKDLSQLPVIQSSVIVRCRSCRTYINPFVTFVDARRWKCNLCYRVNELPEEFSYDPVSKTYGDPQRRPEIRSSTIEFIAPSDYMLRPPQPAVYLFLLDVSFNAVETGYLSTFCRTLLDDLDRLPGDTRTQIGFITYDSMLYFYGLDPENSHQPQMFVVSDLDEVFLPSPDSLLVNLHEAKDVIVDFLTRLPTWFAKNLQTGSALGPALQAAYKLMSPTGGRITVVQTQLPTIGAGALKSREEADERTGKKLQHLTPATDFYKKLSLDCSAQQIAVDLFMLNTQFADIATVAGISKYSGGSTYYFPGFHTLANVAEAERFESALHRYFNRKIGFEAVMRIRCTKGLSIHTFHGNFFVRSTDLLSLPNINPDAGFGVQVSIEDNLDVNYVSFQAALLYTSSKAERRIRVHTLCLPVTSQLGDVCMSGNQQVIIGLLSKMAVDKTLSGSLSDAREAMINVIIDMLTSYRSTLVSPGQFSGQLPCPYNLRLIPVYILAMLKSMAFRIGTSTKLDDRFFAMEQCKNLPLRYLMKMLHPDLYPVHALDDKDAINHEDKVIPQPPILPLSSAHIDRHGAYLLDTGSHMYLWLGASLSDQFCQDVLGCQCFQKLPETMNKLPDLSNPTIDRLFEFINHLNDQRPYNAPLTILREDSRMRGVFLQYLIEDRTESTLSYNEFLLHIQKDMKS